MKEFDIVSKIINEWKAFVKIKISETGQDTEKHIAYEKFEIMETKDPVSAPDNQNTKVQFKTRSESLVTSSGTPPKRDIVVSSESSS